MDNDNNCHHKWQHGHQASSGLYGLGFIGALVYYIQHADSLVAGLIGVAKALVWPAILVYMALTQLFNLCRK